MLFAEVVEGSERVAATRSRTAKAAAIADVLRQADAAEVRAVAAWLAGDTLQARLGVGWRTLSKLAHDPAPAAELTIADVDTALTALADASGPGSTARREHC